MQNPFKTLINAYYISLTTKLWFFASKTIPKLYLCLSDGSRSLVLFRKREKKHFEAEIHKTSDFWGYSREEKILFYSRMNKVVHTPFLHDIMY